MKISFKITPEQRDEIFRRTGRKPGIGDRIEKLVHPVAVAINWPCLDEEKKGLKPESGCAKMRDGLNKL